MHDNKLNEIAGSKADNKLNVRPRSKVDRGDMSGNVSAAPSQSNVWHFKLFIIKYFVPKTLSSDKRIISLMIKLSVHGSRIISISPSTDAATITNKF